MNIRFFLTLNILSLVFLSGCVGREQADAHLQKGCEAAIGLYVPEGFTIKEIKSVTFSTPKDRNEGSRKVSLSIVESDGWYDAEKTHNCNFEEKFGFMNMTHEVDVYQVNIDGKIYGKQGNDIIGGYNELQKISNAVADAINN